MKCWYLSAFILFAIFILVSAGTVSSKMVTLFFVLSTTTTSGLRFVIRTFGGMVPPAGVWWPGMSIKQEKLVLQYN